MVTGLNCKVVHKTFDTQVQNGQLDPLIVRFAHECDEYGLTLLVIKTGAIHDIELKL